MKISILWISIFFSIYIVAFLTFGFIIVFDFNSTDLIIGFSTIIQFAIMIGILLAVIFLEDKFVYLKSLFNLPEKSKLKFGGLIVLVSLLDFILVIAYTIIYDSLGSTPQEVELFVDANSAGDPLILFILFLSICIGAPLVEELIFRGYILDSIRSNHSDTFAIIGSGLLFGFMHWDPIFGFFDLFQAGATAIGGMLYAWLRLRTGSIWPPILCHFIWNGSIFIFEFIL